MGLIQILPSLIAERIAAGEVIERPASVVKELCENSIDAGATAIDVRLLRGGIDLIEITDNGIGMEREDLELCIARHATSKIKNFDDLTRLHTLGFRGEALPSIASVSELTITSRKKQNNETYEIKLNQISANRAESTQVANLSFLGASHGTRVRVAGLFSQIPARLKFLKTQGAEAGAVREILERLALTHPEISFKLTSDDRTLLNLPSEDLKNRAVRMLSDDNPFETKEVNLPGPYSIEVIWLKGLSVPHSRSIYQIVNGRALRDRTLQMAILNPLKQSYLPGHYPACVVKIEVPPSDLDVNVHPTKTEIRFLDSGKIFSLCAAAFAQLLGQEAVSKLESRPYSPSHAGYTPYLPNQFNLDSVPEGHFQSNQSHYEPSFIDDTPIGSYRGVLFSTYFMFERGDEITLVDQHAAHERIRYEKLKAAVLNHSKIESQALLVPEVVKVQYEKAARLRDRLPLLGPLGFEAEIFGEDAVVFRSIPFVWGNKRLPERLKNLIERAIEVAPNELNLAWDEALFEKIAMEACRSSFKAGDVVHDVSALDLTRKLFECEHPGNCPHGRPTTVKLSKNKVEEWFNRLS